MMYLIRNYWQNLSSKFHYLSMDEFYDLETVTIEKINLINYKLTKREELLFLTVLAFPKASSTGLDCKITSLIFWALFPLPET